MHTIFAKMLYELEKHHNLILATIIQGDGSTPRGAGSQMLVGARGRIIGTIGGGAVEHRTELLAQELLHQEKSALHKFQLYKNEAEDIGMACGGDVTVWLQFIHSENPLWTDLAGKLLACCEQHRGGWLILHQKDASASLLDENGTLLTGNPVDRPFEWMQHHCVLTAHDFSMPLPIGERAVIFGGGHCAQALAPLLRTVGFRVTVMEQRPEYARKELFAGAEAVICGDYLRVSDYLTLTGNDYVVIMTNGHSHDFEIQAQLLRQPLAYIGVIGSKKKAAAVNARLREAGIGEEAIACVHTPIGTKIKAVTPEEIAVSIAGEMIYERALRREAAGILFHDCPMQKG